MPAECEGAWAGGITVARRTDQGKLPKASRDGTLQALGNHPKGGQIELG